LRSNSCLRLPDGVENALSSRMTQNAKDQQIRRDKRNKRCNSYKQHKSVHEIKLPQKYACRDAQRSALVILSLAILACFSIAGWNSTTGRPRTVIGCAQGDYIHAVSR
jgi:hypothetical protein